MEWIETGQGTKISNQATIAGADKIALAGHCVICSRCTIEGNVQLSEEAVSSTSTKRSAHSTTTSCTVSVGEYCLLEPGVQVKPPVIGYRKSNESGTQSDVKRPIYSPLNIDSYVWIGENCKVYCTSLGSRIIIGANSQLNRCCQVGNVVVIEEGVTVPERYNIPSYSRVSKHPRIASSILVEPLLPSFAIAIEEVCKKRYLGICLEETYLPRMVSDLTTIGVT